MAVIGCVGQLCDQNLGVGVGAGKVAGARAE